MIADYHAAEKFIKTPSHPNTGQPLFIENDRDPVNNEYMGVRVGIRYNCENKSDLKKQK